MDHLFLFAQNGSPAMREHRLLGFAPGGGEAPQPPKVEAPKPGETNDEQEPPEVKTSADIIRESDKRAAIAQKDVAVLNNKIQELQTALNSLSAKEEGDSQALGQKKEGQGAPKVMDIDALFKKYNIEVSDNETDAQALSREIGTSTELRDQKAKEVSKAEGERKQAEEGLMENASPEDRIGMRVNQLMRAKSLPEFISGALKAFAEAKMFFAGLKQQIKDGIFGPEGKKGESGSPDAPKKEDPLTVEIRKKGAAKTIEEATAVKTAAESALNDASTGLKKQKTDLTNKKTELSTAIATQESALSNASLSSEDKTKTEETLKTAKADLKTIEGKIAQVDTDIAKQNALIEGADKKLARVTEMKTATEQTRGKLETMSTAMIQTIDNSDMKDKPEGKAIRNMLDGTRYEADGLSITILDTNDAEITEAKGSLTKLGLDPTALDVEKRGDKTYIKDPSKFSAALEKLSGKLNQDTSIKTLGLAKSSDGKGYIREGYSGKYFPQADGSIFYEGGTKGGKKVEANTYVDGKWNDVRTPNADTASLVASAKAESEAVVKEKCGKAIKDLNLVQSADGKSYIREGGYTGKYYAQPDGSIFYEGGKKPDGKDAPAQTYVDGKWDQARTTPLPGVDVAAKASPAEVAKPKNPTDAINAAKQELKLQVAKGGVLTRPGYTGRYFAQKDGSIFYEGGVGPSKKTLNPITYVDGKWDPTRNTRLA